VRSSGNGSVEDAPADSSSSSSSAAPLVGGAAAAANGYLAGAELALHLKLPALAGQLLELAAGLCCCTLCSLLQHFIQQVLNYYE
jgi:hypothetical protein